MDDINQAPKERPPLRISNFPDDGNVWRVDWFGSIAFPDRIQRRKHPSVLVSLSKVMAPDALLNPAALLDPLFTSPKQTKRWISVGTTMLTGVGDLWQNQTLVASPDYEVEAFHDIELNRDTAHMVKAGSSLEADEGFLLPMAEHPWHMGNTHSYCLRVTLPDGRYLVVPCMELVRFYFGSSSDLLNRLFTPPLTRDKLYSKAAWDLRRRKLSLNLADQIHGASAADIGRIAGDDAAWLAAMLVPSSCLRASVSGREIYPQAAFPFEGMTTLIASGKWLSQGDRPRQTFLVYQLRSCAHPFPFKALRYSLSGHATYKHRRTNEQGDHSSDAANAGSSRARASRQPTDPTLIERDASSALSPQQYVVNVRRRFPDLQRKTVWAKKAVQSGSAPMMSKGAPVNDLAVGESGSTQRVRPVTIAQALQNDNTAVPPFLKCVVDALRCLEDFDIDVLTASQEDGWTVPLTLLADDDGVIADEYFVSEGTGPRPRRVAVFEVVSQGDCTLMVVVEATILTPFLYPVEARNGENLERAVNCVAKDFLAIESGVRKAGMAVDWQACANADAFVRDWLADAFLDESSLPSL